MVPSDKECILPLDAPAILVDGGLTCTSQDIPGSSFLRLAISRGFRIVVIERRGHAMPLTKPRWNLFGDSDDFEQTYKAIRGHGKQILLWTKHVSFIFSRNKYLSLSIQ